MKWIVKGKINVLEVAEVLSLISRKLPADQVLVAARSDAGTARARSGLWCHRISPQTRPDQTGN